MTLQQIRTAYGVPAARGRAVLFGTGDRQREATILSCSRTGLHLWVRFADDGRRCLLHPTWQVTYPPVGADETTCEGVKS